MLQVISTKTSNKLLSNNKLNFNTFNDKQQFLRIITSYMQFDTRNDLSIFHFFFFLFIALNVENDDWMLHFSNNKKEKITK